MSLTNLVKKVKPVCDHCGASDLRVEAYLEWDIRNQTWKIGELIDDHQVCNSCGKDCKPRWVLA
jgi:hypothetical protein